MELAASFTDYLAKKDNWDRELILLREVILSTPVKETIKWGAPAYTFNDENIIGLAAFKNYVGIWFHQGVFLKDAQQVLYNANEENTRGLRQWRFSNLKEIEATSVIIKAYVLEAIENQKAGKKIKINRNKKLIIPQLIADELNNNEGFKLKFNLFSNSKKREFCEYIIEAKQEKTKLKRLEKVISFVQIGKGLNDHYK